MSFPHLMWESKADYPVKPDNDMGQAGVWHRGASPKIT